MSEIMLGNKLNCVIRIYGGADDQLLRYQPYTILQDVEATFSFSRTEKQFTTRSYDTAAYWSADTLTSIALSNVPLTSRIINMLYEKNEEPQLISHTEVVKSDSSGKIYFTNTKEKYQVFIIDNADALEKSYGKFSADSLIVKKPNSEYLVNYYTLTDETNKVFNFNKKADFYFTLDFEWLSNNNNNQTAKGYIHIERASVYIDNKINFNRFGNKANLQFNVINDDKNYILFE